MGKCSNWRRPGMAEISKGSSFGLFYPGTAACYTRARRGDAPICALWTLAKELPLAALEELPLAALERRAYMRSSHWRRPGMAEISNWRRPGMADISKGRFYQGTGEPPIPLRGRLTTPRTPLRASRAAPPPEPPRGRGGGRGRDLSVAAARARLRANTQSRKVICIQISSASAPFIRSS